MSPSAFPISAFLSVFLFFVYVSVFVSVCVSVSELLTQMVENIDAGCHHWLSLASALSASVGGKLQQQQRPGGESLFWLRHPPRSQRMVAASSLRLFLPPIHCSAPTLLPQPSPSFSESSSLPETVILISVWPILLLSTSSPPELAPPTEYRIFGRVNRDKSRRRAGGR